MRLRKITISRGTVSSIYSVLFSARADAYTAVQQAWERDLNVSLSPSQWEALWRNAIYSSKCVQFRIIQYKIMCRAYFTSVSLSKMDEKCNNKCWHGCGARGSLFHPLWECPDVSHFWSMVVSTMSVFLGVTLLVCPLACVLGQAPQGNHGSIINRLWSLGCLTTKRIILRNWKERKKDCFQKDSWVREYLDLLNMERAACLLKDFDKRMEGHWDIVREHLII